VRLVPKVLLVSWAVALIPLAGVGWVLKREMTHLSLQNARTVQETLAQRTVDVVRRKMDEAIDRLSLLGRMGDLSGNKAEKSLAAAMDSSPFFTDIWLYDGAGDVRAYIHRLGFSPGLTSREWPQLKKVITEKGSYAGPTFYSNSQSPRKRMGVALRDGQGFLVGLLNLYLLQEDLTGLDLGTGGRVFILDQKGRLVAHSLAKEPVDFVSPPDDAYARDYTAWDGTPVIGLRFPVPGSDLQIIFEQPAAMALAAALKVQHRFRWALVIGATFAGLLALVLGVIVSRSLRNLRSAISKMKEGQFDVLVNIRSQDELGDLARTISEAQGILEKRVRDSVLGRLSRLIGHDMRQPVQAARTALDTTLRHLKEVDETGILHLRYCFDAFDQMDDFIEDILTVGRDRTPNRHDINLNELAQTVIRRLHRPETLTLDTRWAPEIPPCPVDEREASRALSNAIKNAIEAAGPNGHVTVSSLMVNNDYVALQVDDDGPGLSQEKKSHLFDEISTKEDGNGLGLLVMKKVMTQHQGKLEFKETPGHGLRVEFHFPTGPHHK
jgi:signal transduction histidine kinase